MKIICTQSQKELLIECLKDSPKCLFGQDIECPPMEELNGGWCGNKCIEENIEWEIEDGEPDG